MRTFAEQALHYLDRPHLRVPTFPLGGHTDAVIVHLDDDQIGELDRWQAATDGRPFESLDESDVVLPRLAPHIDAWSAELVDGCGVVVVRGLPVEAWGPEATARVFFVLGLALGEPGAQNPQGDLLGHVVDTGEDHLDPMVRLYRTNAEIRFHCDLADVVGLCCLATPRRGGESRLASSVAVVDELARRRPDLVDRLFRPFHLDTRNEDGLRTVPVPMCAWDGRRLSTFFHSDYFRSATRHPEVGELDPEARQVIDLVDEIAASDGVRLDLAFEVGDVQLVSNHTVIHGRGAYVDDPDHPRHLLRLWLSVER